MLKDKIQALLKSLPQRPRSRFVPLPESPRAPGRPAGHTRAWGHGSLTDALLKLVRDETSLDVKRADFKLDMLPAPVHELPRGGRAWPPARAWGRNLGALKAELGAQARGAFQALAG
jgi:ATP-dependent helicase HrpA